MTYIDQWLLGHFVLLIIIIILSQCIPILSGLHRKNIYNTLFKMILVFNIILWCVRSISIIFLLIFIIFIYFIIYICKMFTIYVNM